MNDHDFLCHHGIKGQKWGVRRYQNYDGSLTPAGKQRYNKKSEAKIRWNTSGLIKKENVCLHSREIARRENTNHDH